MEGGGDSSGAPRNIHLPFVSCKVPAAAAAAGVSGSAWAGLADYICMRLSWVSMSAN